MNGRWRRDMAVSMDVEFAGVAAADLVAMAGSQAAFGGAVFVDRLVEASGSQFSSEVADRDSTVADVGGGVADRLSGQASEGQ